MTEIGMGNESERDHDRDRETQQRAEVVGDDSDPVPVVVRTSWIGPVEER